VYLASDINELSQFIGELRNFATQQGVTNGHILEELKKISERMSSFGEIGATFVEYRKTLHERFGKIHDIFAEHDERLDKIEAKNETMNSILVAWQSQLKMVVAVACGVCTVLSTLMTSYGGSILRALMTH
jgi:heterodisulfide reductase subunit C